MMDEPIPSLWSDDVAIDVVPPITILRVQATALEEKTKGVLKGDVSTVSSDSGRFLIQFDIIASALQGSRYRLLTVSGSDGESYPVAMEFPTGGYKEVATQHEFIDLLQSVLQSPPIRSKIQSLIVKSKKVAKGVASS